VESYSLVASDERKIGVPLLLEPKFDFIHFQGRKRVVREMFE